jgi:hypothetical protein
MKKSFWQLASIAALFLVGCAMGGGPQALKVSLTGAQEIPPVTTSASGSGDITIMADHTVSGRITTVGIVSTVAHFHQAPAPGQNGPVILPLKKTDDNTYVVPEGAKLTDAQYASYKAGNLYINVHSAAHPGGEIRGQLTPPASPGY